MVATRKIPSKQAAKPDVGKIAPKGSSITKSETASYKQISAEEEPSRKIRGFWSIMLILLPIALLFAENSLYSLQGVTIIAAFPIGIMLVMIVWSFFKDCNEWLLNKNK